MCYPKLQRAQEADSKGAAASLVIQKEKSLIHSCVFKGYYTLLNYGAAFKYHFDLF